MAKTCSSPAAERPKSVTAAAKLLPHRTPPTGNKGGIQSVDRALLILDVMAEKGGEVSLTELASATGLHVSTCHHLISTLVAWGYVARDPSNRNYQLGPHIFFLSNACLRQIDLPRLAKLHLDNVSAITGEAVQLAVLQGTDLVTLIRRECSFPVRVDAGMSGKSNAAHATATGKAILAWLPETEVERIILEKGLTAFTPRTITDPNKLREDLRLVRRNGFSTDRQEFQPSVICIGAAVRDHAGGVVGAISASTPVFRATSEHLEKMRAAIVGATRALSLELGAPNVPQESMAALAAAAE
jgi:IclR family acetate operon transcriptional repressor